VQDGTWDHTERALEMLDSMSAWVLRYGEAAAAGGPAAAAAPPADPAPGLLTGGLPDVRSAPAETQVRAACRGVSTLQGCVGRPCAEGHSIAHASAHAPANVA